MQVAQAGLWTYSLTSASTLYRGTCFLTKRTGIPVSRPQMGQGYTCRVPVKFVHWGEPSSNNAEKFCEYTVFGHRVVEA